MSANNLTTNRLKLIWQFAKPYKFSFFNSFFCHTVADFINILYPFIFGLLIDEVFYHKNMDFFKTIVISYGILFVGQALLSFVQTSVGTYIYARFMFDVKRKIFEKIFTLKASYLSSSQTGDLITRTNKDADEVMNLILWSVLFMLSNFMKILAAVVFVITVSVKIALLMFVAVPLSVFIALYFGKKVRTKFEAYRENYGRYIGWVYEMISGVREIQLLAGERNVTRHFVRYCSKLINLKIKSSLIELYSERTNAFVSLLSDVSLYAVSALLIIKGEMTVGGFIAAAGYFGIARESLKFLSETNIRLQNNMVSINKVFEILEQDMEPQESSAPDIVVSTGNIEFKGVAFRYNEQSNVLEDIDLSIKNGEKIAIVGKSGAGKSTILNLLLRFYEPQKGSIEIDGQDIQKYSLKSLRRSIGIVQQEALMFDGTISYNLKLGNPHCNEADMWEACSKASIADFIRTLPQGFDTVIGEGGVNLSGGQRQRLAIARIILKNPRILIFDEATSALDYESEKTVQQACDELRQGRTSISIAHRLSTIVSSDRVAVLHEGKIVSFDHHLKLLESCEYYRQLFREQYMEEEAV
ncbi:MAG: ABC transporter ATP-binding protein/permease [Clostridia bacterium]|nr:ABC transporter ATP-binding protein/permease [Clostridia bacterium]